VFFLSFSEFDYDSSRSPPDEMQRLRRFYGWTHDNPRNKDAWTEYRKALVQEFNLWYGTNENSLEAWHSLCRAIGISPLPTSCGSCRAVSSCNSLLFLL